MHELPVVCDILEMANEQSANELDICRKSLSNEEERRRKEVIAPYKPMHGHSFPIYNVPALIHFYLAKWPGTASKWAKKAVV